MSARFVIGRESEGKTLAAVVRAALEGASWNRARDLCASGRVSLDGERVLDAAARVRSGQTVEIDEKAPRLRSGTLAREACRRYRGWPPRWDRGTRRSGAR